MTHLVGQKGSNALGLYDMHGNVYEWCCDWYDDAYYKRSSSADPRGPSQAPHRVIRGGCWLIGARYCRSASRLGYLPANRLFILGFRLALSQSAEIGDQSASTRPEPRQPPESGSTPPSEVLKPRLAAAAEPTSLQRPSIAWTSHSTAMTFVRIEGREFMTGSPPDDNAAQNDEKPQHKVRISPFLLGVTEVTQAQYMAVMANNPSRFSSTGGGGEMVAGRPTDRLPVEQVSWLDAVRFCNSLSKKDGLNPYYDISGENVRVRNPKGPGYRLPTEAEWEYACRAGKSTRYSFGDDPS